MKFEIFNYFLCFIKLVFTYHNSCRLNQGIDSKEIFSVYKIIDTTVVKHRFYNTEVSLVHGRKYLNIFFIFYYLRWIHRKIDQGIAFRAANKFLLLFILIDGNCRLA